MRRGGGARAPTMFSSPRFSAGHLRLGKWGARCPSRRPLFKRRQGGGRGNRGRPRARKRRSGGAARSRPGGGVRGGACHLITRNAYMRVHNSNSLTTIRLTTSNSPPSFLSYSFSVPLVCSNVRWACKMCLCRFLPIRVPLSSSFYTIISTSRIVGWEALS